MGVFSDFVSGFAIGSGYSPEGSTTEDRKLSAAERADLISGISQMRLALARAYRQQNDSAIQLLSEQMDTYNSNRKLSGEILRTVLTNEGKVDVARLQAQAANIRNLRDNRVKALTTINSAGDRMYQSIVLKYLDPTLQLSPSDRSATIWAVLKSMPPSPETSVAMSLAQQDPSVGPPPGDAAGAVGRAQAAYDLVRAQVDALDSTAGKLDAGGTPTPAESVAILEILRAPQALPTYAEAKTTVGDPEGISGIEGQIASFERQLADTRGGADYRPTNEELQALAANPSYRKWAEARGFRLGDVRDSGVYVQGRGDLGAFLAARLEKQGKTLFTGAGKLGDAEQVEVFPAVQTPSTPVEPPPEEILVDDDTVVFVDEEGTVKILTPSMDFIRELDPEKDSADIKAAAAKLKPEAPEPLPNITLEGRAIPPAYGDNINTTKRLAVRDGNMTFEVVLKKNDAGQWVESERIERPRYNFLQLPVAPGVSSEKERKKEQRSVVQAERSAAKAADQEQAVIQREEKKAEQEAVAAEKEAARAEKEVLYGPGVIAPAPTPVDERGKPEGALPPQKRDVPPILTEEESAPVIDVSTEFAAPASPVDRSPEDQALDRKIERMASGPGGVSGFTPADAERQQQLAIQQADRALALSTSTDMPKAEPAPQETSRQRLMRKYGKSVGAAAGKAEPLQ